MTNPRVAEQLPLASGGQEAQQSDLEYTLRTDDRLAIAILKRDAEMPGLAIMVVRGIIQRPPPSDAATLLKQPKAVQRDVGDDGKPLRFDPTLDHRPAA